MSWIRVVLHWFWNGGNPHWVRTLHTEAKDRHFCECGFGDPSGYLKQVYVMLKRRPYGDTTPRDGFSLYADISAGS